MNTPRRAEGAPSARRLASDEPMGPAYRTDPPPTRGEAKLTAGVEIEPGVAYGFFTDSSVCIGCKACEVACKQWNQLPMDEFGFRATSYDNTSLLQATTWRHVEFVEEFRRPSKGTVVPVNQTDSVSKTESVSSSEGRNRWIFMSDVCKHCENAGCLEACPTGAIVRTEFGSILIQQDICNGCHYCVPSCPFGVITVAHGQDNQAHKCTLCYDRLKAGMEPACAKVCPTDSIQFGPVSVLRDRARERLQWLHERGEREAFLYGLPDGPEATGGIGGLNCFFLLTERPEAFNLPAAPELPSRRVLPASLTAAAAALLWGAATVLAIRGARKRHGQGRGGTR